MFCVRSNDGLPTRSLLGALTGNAEYLAIVDHRRSV